MKTDSMNSQGQQDGPPISSAHGWFKMNLSPKLGPTYALPRTWCKRLWIFAVVTKPEGGKYGDVGDQLAHHQWVKRTGQSSDATGTSVL